MSSINRCPIPTCKKPIATKKFMCGEHRRMISPDAWARVQKCRADLKRSDMDIEQRDSVRQTMRMALALAFAEVCDRCNIDPTPFLSPQPVPEQFKPIARAIMTEIERG